MTVDRRSKNKKTSIKTLIVDRLPLIEEQKRYRLPLIVDRLPMIDEQKNEHLKTLIVDR